MINARELIGEIDFYLFDQILKNYFTNQMRILDVGFGGGRNLTYLLRNGFEIYGIDQNPEAIEYVRSYAKTLAPNLPAENFQVGSADKMPFADKHFDAVITSTIFHFIDDERHFNQMLEEIWRVLKSGGLLLLRLASSIGVEDNIKFIRERRYLLADRSEQFLIDEQLFIEAASRLKGTLVEPLRTTNMQDSHSITTWILRK